MAHTFRASRGGAPRIQAFQSLAGRQTRRAAGDVLEEGGILGSDLHCTSSHLRSPCSQPIAPPLISGALHGLCRKANTRVVMYVTDGIASVMAQAKAAGDRNVLVHDAYTAQRALRGPTPYLEVDVTLKSGQLSLAATYGTGRAPSSAGSSSPTSPGSSPFTAPTPRPCPAPPTAPDRPPTTRPPSSSASSPPSWTPWA
jgi:hypothetical protein